MQAKSSIHRVRSSTKVLAAMAIASAFIAGRAHASAIDVALANFSTTTTTGNATNSGINPITYTPVHVTIPVASGKTYDAADLTDTGTTWNSLQSVSTTPTTVSSGVTQVLYEQNIPLVDSSGATTSVTLNASAIESNGKTDAIHTGHNDAAGAGTDGLAPGPSTTLDGYGTDAGAAHLELMNTAWVANGAAEGVSFTLNGLTPDGSYDLYVYGAGTVNGQGATFAMAAANGGASATTNSSTSSEYRSVFAADGVTPVTAGESWNMLVGTADNSGSLTFTAMASETTGAVKPSIDGFQIDAVPEPGSLGLIALAGLALRRRK
jgi:PEP-CTERM motif